MQGSIQYEITGIYPAQSFFQVRDNGDLVIARPLTSDSLQLAEYTLTVAAWDSVYPDMRAEQTVIVGVRRNENAPRFRPSASYQKSISDAFQVGEVVLTVEAEDGDPTVSELNDR